MVNSGLAAILGTVLTTLSLTTSPVTLDEPDQGNAASEQIGAASQEASSQDAVLPDEVQAETVKAAASKADENPSAAVRVEVRTEVRATSDDAAEDSKTVSGRVIVIGPDGTKREFDLNQKLPSEVQGLLQRQLSEGQVREGNQTRVFQLRTRTTGPDSANAEKTQSIILQGTELRTQNESDQQLSEKRLMIGVHCGEADELLRAHLKLGETGLVVIDVVADSPAAEAGLQKHDLLLRAGELELKTVQDLLKGVQENGEQQMTLNLLRKGDPLTVNLTPRLMQQPGEVVITIGGIDVNSQPGRLEWKGDVGVPEQLQDELKRRMTQLRLRQIPPGIMIDKSLPAAEIERLIEQAAQAARDASRVAAAAHGSEIDRQSPEVDLQAEIKAMKEQLTAVLERLSKLEQQR